MQSAASAPLKITAVNDRALVRLIPDSAHQPPVLRGLVDDDREAAILAEIEGRTNARLMVERDGTAALDRRELVFARRTPDLSLYGVSHINAAFTYTRPTGNRFNTKARGAWYCAWDSLTSLHEVGYHRTRELQYINRLDDTAVYRELLADFIGDFPEITDDDTVLHPDPVVGYPAGQALATELRRDGHRALIYPSVRHAGGRCLVAFDPAIIQNVRPGAAWQLTWQGTPAFLIEGC